MPLGMGAGWQGTAMSGLCVAASLPECEPVADRDWTGLPPVRRRLSLCQAMSLAASAIDFSAL